MNILEKIFGSKKPILKKEDIPNIEKVADFTIKFIKSDPIANVISNKSSNIIFNEGHRPRTGAQNNPELVDLNISNLTDWFIVKIFIDLNFLKDANKEMFTDFIDIIDEGCRDTLITAGEIAVKYHINFKKFVYEKEIEKIPISREREWFKINFLNDNVLNAEMRILAWLYHSYYGEWYQLKENRNEKIAKSV